MKTLSMIIFLSSVYLSYEQAVRTKVYSLRSAFRQKHQTTDCNLLKVSTNSRGEPSGLGFNGHCCEKTKFKDFKVNLFPTNRGLTATIQWSHNNSYYLTAKTTGNQVALEKLGTSSFQDKHKFVVKSTRTPGCSDCISLQSTANNKYLVSGPTGLVSMTTNSGHRGALLRLHTCDAALLILCRFIAISC